MVISFFTGAANVINDSLDYKTDLINDTEWTTDPSVGVINATENGLIQVDSDLDLETVFYRILTQ